MSNNMPATRTLPVIQKDQVVPNSGDYEALLKQGLELISQYSGLLWTNYNTGDPGITILQSLCYAMTELSYKANLPIEDLLTNAQGQINYKNALEKPWQILPINPVSLSDFKKIIIDEEAVIKQIYFEELGKNSSFNTITPYIELTPAALPLFATSSYMNKLGEKVKLLLNERSNVGQSFLDPVFLRPFQIHCKGEIQLSDNVSAEKALAQLLFEVNNYLSPYPKFYSYSDLLETGWTNSEIFDGPLLQNGFLKPEDFCPKRKLIKQADLAVFISTIDSVDSVLGFELIHNKELVEGLTILKLPFDVAPFANLKSFLPSVEFVQHGKVISQVSETKVKFELNKLRPKRDLSSPLEDYLPKGTYRDVKEYYSIQYQFPPIYKLAKSNYSKVKSPQEAAKIKQLKAYLILMEQIMADFLAQLSKVGRLFSFDSGRNVYQLAGKTYFFQDLYEVPGIQELLADVKGAGKVYNDRTALEDWKAYKRDHLNTYRQQLMHAGESPQVNLDRKSRVLKHLLARFGESYSSDYLHLNNPSYGKETTAAVQHISETLKHYSLFSANRGRTYFHDFDTDGFASGYELVCGNKLNINSYYEGVIELIEESVDHKPAQTLLLVAYTAAGHSLLFGKPQSHQISAVPAGNIAVYQQGKLLLSFSSDAVSSHLLSANAARQLLKPYCDTLSDLRKNTQGFVFIDNLKLLSFLHFQWEVRDAAGQVLYNSQFTTFDTLQHTLALIQSKLPLEIVPEQGKYSIELRTEQDWSYSICRHIPTEKKAESIRLQLYAFRKGVKEAIQMQVYSDTWEKTALSTTLFEYQTTALFPAWVHLLQENAYRAFLYRTLMMNLPAPLRVDLHFLQQAEMKALLSSYTVWLHGLKRSLAGHPVSTEAREAAWNIFEFLNRLS